LKGRGKHVGRRVSLAFTAWYSMWGGGGDGEKKEKRSD